MSFIYDLHVHTAVSPCGDLMMTPHNIVNMSLLKGLEVIAITDHQTTANCEAVMEVGRKKGLLVIPGIEIECREEFHLIALFTTLKEAQNIEQWIKEGLPKIKNRKDIFGEQLVFNEEDEIVGEIEQLLLTATQIGVSELVREVKRQKGVIYPAHIDRKSYSILSNLGDLPQELNFNTLEISKQASLNIYQEKYSKYTVLQSSDAHYLFDISEERRLLPSGAQELMDLINKINKNNKDK